MGAHHGRGVVQPPVYTQSLQRTGGVPPLPRRYRQRGRLQGQHRVDTPPCRGMLYTRNATHVVHECREIVIVRNGRRE
jgi:hypothetical protein